MYISIVLADNISYMLPELKIRNLYSDSFVETLHYAMKDQNLFNILRNLYGFNYKLTIYCICIWPALSIPDSLSLPVDPQYRPHWLFV